MAAEAFDAADWPRDELDVTGVQFIDLDSIYVDRQETDSDFLQPLVAVSVNHEPACKMHISYSHSIFAHSNATRNLAIANRSRARQQPTQSNNSKYSRADSFFTRQETTAVLEVATAAGSINFTAG